MNIAAIILAAGASRRMGGFPKALLRIGEELLADRMIRLFRSCGASVVVVVRDTAVGEALTQPATIVINPVPENGQLSSLQCGLRALTQPIDAVFFTPVDFPGLAADTPQLMVDSFTPDDSVLIPEFEGRGGHPVLISARLIPELLALPHAASARDVLSRHPARNISTGDRGILHDVDTPDDLRKFAGVVQ